MMYYRKSNTIGIGEKFGNKQQIFGFGGKKEPVKTESQLRGIAKEIIMDMNMGMDMRLSSWPWNHFVSCLESR